MSKRTPKYLTHKRHWLDVTPGMLVGASWGFAPLEIIGMVHGRVYVKLLDQCGWFQDPSQTITVATINPDYEGR